MQSSLFLVQNNLTDIPNIFSISIWKCLYQVRIIAVFPVFRLLTDFVCVYTYEFWLYLWRIVRSSVVLLLPLFSHTLLKKVMVLVGNQYKYVTNLLV
jgi:hypothetical protein